MTDEIVCIKPVHSDDLDCSEFGGLHCMLHVSENVCFCNLDEPTLYASHSHSVKIEL